MAYLPKPHEKARVARTQYKRPYVPPWVRSRVWDRDQGVCAKCGRQCGIRTSKKWQANHIRSLAEGGKPEDLDNLETLCMALCHPYHTAQVQKRLAKAKRIQNKAILPTTRTSYRMLMKACQAVRDEWPKVKIETMWDMFAAMDKGREGKQ